MNTSGNPKPPRTPLRPEVACAAVLFAAFALQVGSGCRKIGGRAGLPVDNSGTSAGSGRTPGSSSSSGSGGTGNTYVPPEGSGTGGEDSGDGDQDGGVVDPSAFTREALLAAFADCAFDQARIFSEKASVLEQAAASEVEAPSPEARDAVRAAWAAAMDQWQKIEVMGFGPLAPTTAPGGQGLREEIYSWPSFNRCFVDLQTVSQKYLESDFPETLPNTRGLGALEYLAFYEATDNGCAATHAVNTNGTWAALGDAEIVLRRAAYAQAAAADVTARAQSLVELWQPESGSAWLGLSSAGDGSAIYPTSQAGLNAVSDALFYVDAEVKDMKVAWPLGIALCTGPCPAPAESPFAGRSKFHIRNNLLGFRLLFEGCGANGSGLGFDDLLVSVDQAELAGDMKTALANAIAALDAIDELSIEAAMLSDAASVQALYDAIKALTDLLKTDFVTVLDLARPMGAEGDND